jgi:hypothetical protein
MEMIEAAIQFLNAYPVWARVCVLSGIVFSALVLVFAQRGPTAAQDKKATLAANKNGPIFLKIKGVKLFPDDSNAEVQVLAIVNGTTFVHPSVGGVKWMKVGPDMSQKSIELPVAQRYDIRFEMRLRNGSTFSGKGSKQLEASPVARAASQMISSITHLPYSEDYKLYDIVGETRAASVHAVVSYEISESQ